MNASSSSSSGSGSQLRGEPTETTALLSTSSHHSLSSTPEAEPAREEATHDECVPAQTSHRKWVLAGTWSSLLAATSTAALVLTIVIMEVNEPQYFYISHWLLDILPGVSVFSIAALILGVLNLRRPPSTNRPVLGAVNLATDALLTFYVGSFISVWNYIFPDGGSCGRPWDGYPDPDHKKCLAFRDIFNIVVGFFFAFSLILCITHAYLFIVRCVQFSRTINFTQPNIGNGVITSLRVSVGPVALEANVKILNTGNRVDQEREDRENSERD